MNLSPHDPRLKAYCDRNAPEIFHSVSYRHDIWKEDPFDVKAIHVEARAAFERLLDRAINTPDITSGRILLLLGESGAGKTHLLRAFRNTTHQRSLGYFGYMQMSSETEDYSRYILGYLIESLDRPYYETRTSTSGLIRLSNALADTFVSGSTVERIKMSVRKELMTAFREKDISLEGVQKAVSFMAKCIVKEPRFYGIDIDLISAFLYLQRNDPYLKNLVLKYLRCENLSPRYRHSLGGIVPRNRKEDPAFLVEWIGRLMWAAHHTPLILCLDQMEDIYNMEDAKVQFRRVMTAARDIADRIPACLVIISCLEDYYLKLKDEVAKSIQDRIEIDPEPVVLDSQRTVEEIKQLAEYRLRYLFRRMNVVFDPADPTAPIPASEIERLGKRRTRDALNWLREYLDKAAAGQMPPPPEVILETGAQRQGECDCV